MNLNKINKIITIRKNHWAVVDELKVYFNNNYIIEI